MKDFNKPYLLIEGEYEILDKETLATERRIQERRKPAALSNAMLSIDTRVSDRRRGVPHIHVKI